MSPSTIPAPNAPGSRAELGGASNTFLAHVVDSPRRFFFNPGYASISRVQVWPADDGFRFVLMSINEPVSVDARHAEFLPGG